jgi:thiol-disulfide isomerase/thioredoxin
MSIWSRWAATLTVAGVCAGACAEPDPALKAKFEQSADAIKKSTAITCKARSFATGSFGKWMAPVRGDIWMLRPSGTGSPWILRVTGSGAILADKPELNFDIVWANTTTWVDDENKKLIERSGPAAGKPGQVASSIKPDDLLGDPLASQLQASAMKAQPSAPVGGVACDVIEVTSADGKNHATWYLGTDDHFPRKVETQLAAGGLGDGTLVLELTDVRLGADLKPDMFKIRTPAGYTEERAPAEAPKPATTTPVAATETKSPPGAPQGTRELLTVTRHAGANVGDLAPAFELAGPDGKKVSLSSLHGNVVLLDFWGTWCLPCKKFSPEVQALSDKYKDQTVKVYGVAVRERTDEAPAKYMNDNKYTFGLLLKGDGVAKDYKVATYPTFVVIGAEGDIALVAQAKSDPKETIAEITRVIDQQLTGKVGARAETTDAAQPKKGD